MVEWKQLGDCIISLKTGLNPRKNFVLNSEGSTNYYITVRELDYWKINPSDKTDKVDDNAIKIINNRSNLEEGDVLFSGTGTIGRTALVNETPKNWNIKEGVYTIKPKKDVLNSKFLIELFHSYYLINKINEYTVGDPIRSVPMKNLVQIQIPIPDIIEQERIVGILDTFTSSIDNLKQQIAQRRKQYEYYRDQLLDFEGKDEKDIHTWGEFCEMIKGNGVQKVDFVDEGVGCIHYGQIYTHYGPYTYETNKFVSQEVFENARKASKGDIIMTDTSENVEDICKSVAYLGEDDIAVSNHALIIKHKQNPKFLSFSTQTKSFFLQKRKVVVGVKVSGIKPEHLAQIRIYLPSLSEQERIVDILDKFETSIQNLEAQLSQREKQYEYYRNKLLTFE